ncbi:hypothetical protein H9Y05_07775 [Crocinitomicaceae bacterium CZZ-1]|uniref:Uncharacterized protein n=1 Tax=Taishania pollutisoli TaxID=2766479 RepID=A0A8J6U276_9FLAO|nr:hypothetical protein [Taishania pollutisoli]MBC9812370.1 hypothetical protein [Taishania pollutisoli]MBX2950346.1 hypothetical protein [Crocinitomicaceae bacterium]NGF74353.1 hypothetical protein [Fluviicola sp. SGL-29]
MKVNFEKLIDTKHMLEWFSDEPFEEITATIEAMFIKQAPDTKMLRFEVTSSPQWLTGGRKSEHTDKMILLRSGLAVTCNFTLQNNDDIYDLTGVFTWVGTNLDSDPRTKIWMDLDGTLEEFGQEGLLKERIYALDV